MADILIPFGKDAVIYYCKCAGAQPSDEEFFFAGVKDVTVTMEKDEADASRRAFPGWHDQRVGMKNLRVSFDIAGVTVDGVEAGQSNEITGLDIIRALYLTDLYDAETGICLLIRAAGVEPAADDDYTGSGMWGDFLCTKFDRNEPLNDLQSYSVEMTMTLIHGTVPAWSAVAPT